MNTNTESFTLPHHAHLEADGHTCFIGPFRQCPLPTPRKKVVSYRERARQYALLKLQEAEQASN